MANNKFLLYRLGFPGVRALRRGDAIGQARGCPCGARLFNVPLPRLMIRGPVI